MTKLETVFINETDVPVDKNAIEQTLELILRRLDGVGRVNIELVIVGDKKITELNKKYRNADKPTDVLSFPEPKSPHDELTGSIVVSVETAKIQADQAGIALTAELKTLAGHGLLHLLGYNHR